MFSCWGAIQDVKTRSWKTTPSSFCHDVTQRHVANISLSFNMIHQGTQPGVAYLITVSKSHGQGFRLGMLACLLVEPGGPLVSDELVLKPVALRHVRQEPLELWRHVVLDEPELYARPARAQCSSWYKHVDGHYLAQTRKRCVFCSNTLDQVATMTCGHVLCAQSQSKHLKAAIGDVLGSCPCSSLQVPRRGLSMSPDRNQLSSLQFLPHSKLPQTCASARTSV